MKNTFACVTGKKFLTATLLFLFVSPAAFNAANAQAVAEVTPVPTNEPKGQSLPTGLRANVHQTEGPLKFKVNFENPEDRLVEIRLLDQGGSVLYKYLFSNTPRKVTTFDLSFLEDGIYTFEISTLSEKYSQSYEIQRQTVRSVRPVKNNRTGERLNLYKFRQSENP